jgi:hypothetical protein
VSERVESLVLFGIMEVAFGGIFQKIFLGISGEHFLTNLFALCSIEKLGINLIKDIILKIRYTK